MSGLVIEEVDPHDEDGLGAWIDTVAAAWRHELDEHATTWSLPELLPMVQQPDRSRRFVLVNGTLGGRVVAAGLLLLRLLDNLDAAEVRVAVAPAVRRRGLGTAMLARLEEIAAADGRTRLTGQAFWPHDGPADGSGSPGVRFARLHGYAYGISEVQRELTLPVDEGRLASLAAEAAPYHADYEIRAWSGPVPEDLVAGWLALSTTLMTEVPAGEMDREDETADVEAFRLSEAIQAAQGRTCWHAVALAPDGDVVAYTQLVEPPVDSSVHVFQWGTLVRGDHRRHRLGLAVKVANLRALQAGTDVARRRVVTWNAEENGPMISINEQLGFVVAARTCELQKKTV